jgi:hypothetical protein
MVATFLVGRAAFGNSTGSAESEAVAA